MKLTNLKNITSSSNRVLVVCGRIILKYWLLSVIIFIVTPLSLWAIEGLNDYYQVNNSETKRVMDETKYQRLSDGTILPYHNVCIDVYNKSYPSQNAFVPTKTWTEWDAFQTAVNSKYGYMGGCITQACRDFNISSCPSGTWNCVKAYDKPMNCAGVHGKTCTPLGEFLGQCFWGPPPASPWSPYLDDCECEAGDWGVWKCENKGRLVPSSVNYCTDMYEYLNFNQGACDRQVYPSPLECYGPVGGSPAQPSWTSCTCTKL